MQQRKAKAEGLFIAVPFGEDHAPNQRESICIVVMHRDVLEQILTGQIITKKVRCKFQNFFITTLAIKIP